MECVSARIPYTTWRLRAFRQLLATSHSRVPRTVRRSISTSRSTDQLDEVPLETTTQNSDSKPVPPSQRLPQSPLLTNPRRGAEKTRKRRPTTQEEADLLKNPWAVMLASPARMCSVSGARLPSDLMGTWGLVRQPDADKLYMMPVGLMQDSLQNKESQSPASSPEPALPDQVKASKSEASGSDEDPFSTPVIRTPKDKQTGRHLVLRIAELLPVLQSITPPLSKNRGKRHSIMRLLPFRWKHPIGPISAHEEQKLVWSQNTPDIVLHSMRNYVSKKLVAVLRKYKRIGTANGVWRALDLLVYSDAALIEALGSLEPLDRMECGAVLLLGSKDVTTAGDASGKNGALDSVSLSQTGSKVPVFDLSVLFAESDMKKLRESHEQFQHTALFFRPEEKIGIDAMVALWKIKRLLSNVDLPEK
ncbi:hypothetical protein N7457_006220 [Penicillium paradoxum]|uniref:uncharacterized protein n=1 Tax=Penicillium paradoxum TaxID=176176 RepID=UPI002548873B|nr:uncharacterized protein N7457_006220 [Penicillium paradoxum]KAJ5781060.1 hypothetical protein N7457_006220 [Penicillium paradoxum]